MNKIVYLVITIILGLLALLLVGMGIVFWQTDIPLPENYWLSLICSLNAAILYGCLYLKKKKYGSNKRPA